MTITRRSAYAVVAFAFWLGSATVCNAQIVAPALAGHYQGSQEIAIVLSGGPSILGPASISLNLLEDGTVTGTMSGTTTGPFSSTGVNGCTFSARLVPIPLYTSATLFTGDDMSGSLSGCSDSRLNSRPLISVTAYIAAGGAALEILFDTITPYGRLLTGFMNLPRTGPVTPPQNTNPPGPLTGLWWNPNESGWGIHFTQRGNIVFAAWYTYDTNGKPKWYVASSCSLPAGVTGSSGSCNGFIYEVTGPVFFGTNFNPSAVRVSQAGTLNVSFSNANSALMTYSLGGQSRTVPITRQVFSTGSTAPAVNYTDLWWNPTESGWGMAIAHQYNVMFLAWYVYDSAGKPTWYVASSCGVTLSGNRCSGLLYRTTGPAFGPIFSPSQVQAIVAGNVTITFADANNATVDYLVDGIFGSKRLTRQLF